MPPVGVKVSLNTEMQKFFQEKTVTPSSGQYPRMTADSAPVSAASVTWTNAEPDTLMEQVLAPANLRRAYQRVVSNKGAPGADGMTVDDLVDYVKQYWPTLKVRLLAGEYHPQGVRKPKGGTRQLGIPSVVDRLIQQALLQRRMPIFDRLFSGYRRERLALVVLGMRKGALLQDAMAGSAVFGAVAGAAGQVRFIAQRLENTTD
jgi:RNA-directed DNA polymerase